MRRGGLMWSCRASRCSRDYLAVARMSEEYSGMLYDSRLMRQRQATASVRPQVALAVARTIIGHSCLSWHRRISRRYRHRRAASPCATSGPVGVAGPYLAVLTGSFVLRILADLGRCRGPAEANACSTYGRRYVTHPHRPDHAVLRP